MRNGSFGGDTDAPGDRDAAEQRVPLATIAGQWGRIGCLGFGGPPAHIALLRRLCVDQRGWLAAAEFEDGVATCNLLPGPASTQLAIYCAWRLRGPAGAVLGGVCFIVPGLALILGLSALFLAASPPLWIRGAGAGAGAAVPVVAIGAALGLAPASWRRATAAAPTAATPAAESPTADSPTAGGPTADSPTARGPTAGGPTARGPTARGPTARGPTADSPTARGPTADSPTARGPAARGPTAGGPAAGGPAAVTRAARPWRGTRVRWTAYLLVGGASAALVGPYLVLVLAACGLAELAVRRRSPGTPAGRPRGDRPPRRAGLPLPLAPLGPLAAPAAAVASAVAATGGLLAVAWVALKVGALSYGGGFVIIPLMQHDAVHTYHWMTSAQFLSAVALGQVTPGPVVQTVAVVGYAAAGVGGGLLAALVAFAPSFAFVLAGGSHFGQLRRNRAVQAFLTGAGPAAIGAIAGAAIPLALGLAHLWQLAVLGLAALWLLALRRDVVTTLVGAGVLGVIAALAGAPLG